MRNFQNPISKNTDVTKTMPNHGSYVINTKNQLLTIEAYNDWNMETVVSYCQSFKKEAMKIKSQHWSSLVDLSEWSLGPPEMILELQKLKRWSGENNQIIEAIVINSALQKQFLLRSCQAGNNSQSRFFDNKAEAIHWLSC
jgi:hypothetical protein